MPELPEVETVCRGLTKTLVGKTISKVIINQPRLRYMVPGNLNDILSGLKVKQIQRRAKYIVIGFDKSNLLLIIHLGMSGKLRFHSKSVDSNDSLLVKPQKHDHVVFQTDEGDTVVYNDPRRFGMIDLTEICNKQNNTGATAQPDPLPHSDSKINYKFFNHLGPEPFDEKLTPEVFHQMLLKRKQAIKQALLDQTLIVGVGNIYASEALWESKISPTRPACEVTLNESKSLLTNIRAILEKAIKLGGSTLRDYRQANGDAGNFQKKFKCYGLEGEACARQDNGGNNEAPGKRMRQDRCKGRIIKIVQAGRSTYYCQSCQS